MKDLLQKIKKEYIKRQGEIGICGAAYSSLIGKKITPCEHFAFQQLIKATALKQITFYNFEDEVTLDSTQFLWKLEDIRSRLNWLDEQINNLK